MQFEEFPVIGPTVNVPDVIETESEPVVDPQLFVNVTPTLPPVVDQVVVILLVPCPAVIVTPAGTVQL